MPNVTLAVDEATLKKVRKIAIDRNTTMTEMVREYLRSVADSDRVERERAVAQLEQTFQELTRPMGLRRLTRDELHER